MRQAIVRRARRLGPVIALSLASAAIGLHLLTSGGPAMATTEEEEIALNLANLLRAARAVIAAKQDVINDPMIGDKGLTGDAVLAETNARFEESTGTDPAAVEPDSPMAQLFQAQMAAIKEVMDEAQESINQPEVGFKGFVPAIFARLVNERFKEKVGDRAEIKVTAPTALVRNRKALPDAWESEHIENQLLAPDWPEGQVFSTAAQSGGREAFRVLVPEYYSAGCLTCHGEPQGEIDVTGYPKEGGKLGDLGGVISITLFR
jgi:Protein of unknown function (DUF3365)